MAIDLRGTAWGRSSVTSLKELMLLGSNLLAPVPAHQLSISQIQTIIFWTSHVDSPQKSLFLAMN
jgi:hypothetical protein